MADPRTNETEGKKPLAERLAMKAEHLRFAVGAVFGPMDMDELVKLLFEASRELKGTDRLGLELTGLRHRAECAEHFIVEQANLETFFCKCELCREVAIGLDNAGFLEDVPEAERWWKQTTEAGAKKEIHEHDEARMHE